MGDRAPLALLLTLTLWLAACNPPLPADIQQAYNTLPETVDFNFDVKPILSDRCFKCHGPDDNSREAGLRLDMADQAVNRLESGNRAIVPGKPGRSALVERILHHDPEIRMPPADSRLELTDTEKAILVKWVEQGAGYKMHWSFIPPQKTELPDAKSPIDHFVQERLVGTGLTPSPAASKETWLRRVSFDLTGLPPTIDEIDNFLKDNSDTAYERVADRLLASPHYGERMATTWLDLARYADTHGYQDDGYRFVWPWRDWVVEAFNDNLPYDQFLTLQLAGDLLPDATQEQRLATTFLRNHRINSEAGIVGEEYRVEYVADRTNTVGTAMLGLTMECARCHDHKYDPISQEEYYGLFAYFNNVRELGEIANEGNPGPLMSLTTPALDETLAQLQADVLQQERVVAEFRKKVAPNALPEVTPAMMKSELNRGLLAHLEFESLEDRQLINSVPGREPVSAGGEPGIVEGYEGNGLRMEHYDVVVLGPETRIERTTPFSVSIWVNPAQDSGYVPIWGNPGNKNLDFKGYELFLDDGRPTVRLCHAVPHNYIEIAAESKVNTSAWTHLVVTYDGSSKADGLRLYINGKEEKVNHTWDNLYKSIRRTFLLIGGANSRGGFSEGMVDEFRFYSRPLNKAEVRWLYDGSLDVDDVDRLEFYLAQNSSFQAQLDALEATRLKEHATRDTIPEIMVMEEMAAPRPAYVLARGVYDAREEQVTAGTPAFVENIAPDTTANRLGLANWITAPNHPLTARVAVNRFWEMLFGQGLVATPGDWGSQGALPSHPSLLDWLALHFVESGWDVKALLKEIVLSETYRQSSKATGLHLERDPDNLLLARGPAFRLPAEMLRDQALAASGLLVRHLGGPPVKPYQPEGLWEELAAIKNSISTYQQDHGDKLYRRSLYTFWKRSSPPPALATFDAPTRELCLVQRPKTSTPLQALVLWNDPQFVEAARVLAERVIKEEDETKRRVGLGFRLLTGRELSAVELKELSGLYEEQRAGFEKDKDRAASLLSIGEFKRDPSLDKTEVAALTVVMQTIMSYDASVMRR